MLFSKEATRQMKHLQASNTFPIDIGSRLELMLDDYLIARLSGGAELRLNQPIPRDAALVTDQPWEGNVCIDFRIFQDDDIYRMYYLGRQFAMTETTPPGDGLLCRERRWDQLGQARAGAGRIQRLQAE